MLQYSICNDQLLITDAEFTINNLLNFNLKLKCWGSIRRERNSFNPLKPLRLLYLLLYVYARHWFAPSDIDILLLSLI
jgi:hypothetical protein